MCRIAGCDEPYLECKVPEGADVSRCTECRRTLGTDEVPLIEGRCQYEDVPVDWYGWNIAEDRWAEYDDDLYGEELGWKKCETDPPDVKEPVVLREWSEECVPFELPDGVIPINVHVTCPQCKEAREWLYAVCHGFIYNEIRDEIFEHWDSSEVMHSFDFGKLVVWCRAPGWERRGRRISPKELRTIVQAAIPYEFKPEVVKERFRLHNELRQRQLAAEILQREETQRTA